MAAYEAPLGSVQQARQSSQLVPTGKGQLCLIPPTLTIQQAQQGAWLKLLAAHKGTLHKRKPR